MSIVLFDTHHRNKLFPLTYTRAVADLRIGILTIREWWEKLTGEQVYIHTDEYLQGLYEALPAKKLIWINAACLPDEQLLEAIQQLDEKTIIEDDKGVIAYCCVNEQKFHPSKPPKLSHTVKLFQNVRRLEYPWQLFEWNDEYLRRQFKLITSGKTSATLSPTNNLIAPENIFAEEEVSMEYCTINASTGPVYLGKHSVIMEGSLIRGPFALGNNSIVKMGAKIYGATTIGPCCAVGGEIKNIIMQAFSNKAHDGYLGDSVIGEWCNFGAGTSCSNVKNTAANVKLYNLASRSYEEVGLKCGVIMGDYTRVAINTSINTGTLMGVCCNVFDDGLTPKYIPNFTWGAKGLNQYEFSKALKDISNWKKLKNQYLKDADAFVLKHIFEHYNERE
jgi:UDP-N-acetylglucosamine diphosphorylase / glucose-1-phosphate thymidylyltransferase / UDP-N-acetylgalactosamine diphosphorylase / glucosamine-1-phosphate N-acetyltransferase / galactosamine-1-phosphate N-acetyltransferase